MFQYIDGHRSKEKPAGFTCRSVLLVGLKRAGPYSAAKKILSFLGGKQTKPNRNRTVDIAKHSSGELQAGI